MLLHRLTRFLLHVRAFSVTQHATNTHCRAQDADVSTLENALFTKKTMMDLDN